MTTIEQIIQDADLRWVAIEARLNAMFLTRGVNTRIRCEIINDYVMKVTLRDYVLAVYFKDTNELMRSGSCFDLHWAGICNVFKDAYEGLIILK